jgi:hypothetical protein
VIVPGVRVGPITRSSTEADLRKAFGADAVKSKDIDIGEGVTQPGTVIYEGIAGKTLAVLWKENRLSAVVICYHEHSGKCLWRTSDGLGFGTTLRDLERRNGKPFELLGFHWDYSGSVTSWQDGKLAGFLKGPGRLTMMLNASAKAEAGLSQDEAQSVAGDKDFLSSHPVMQKLNPAIYSLQMVWPE